MHEAAIASALLDAAAAALPEDAAGPVVRVDVRVGRLTSVVPDALAFAFDVLRAGTPFAQAALAIDVVPIGIVCEACGARAEIDGLDFVCPACGSAAVCVERGRELELVALELA